ncbi:MAG: putative ABC transporter permease [Clostridia bacterium]|nr:putative ABC transporter permease [Clostridia bacterium]
MNTQKQTTTKIRRSIFAASFVFLAVSYLGWVYETLLCAVCYGAFSDRGFLTLPFCPIYGGVVCGLGLFVGTPTEGNLAEGIGRLCRRYGWSDGVARALRYTGYYLLCVLLATAVELIVGLLFQRLGYVLWSYASEPYNFKGFVCPSVSICWGFLLTVGMRYPYTWLMRLANAAPRKTLAVPSVLLLTAMLADFIFCILR